ncbi:hypothetical protein [Marininema halotolerans]|uniref:Uncharacterized protein n=1 Tax=Marininema halotolerans TaxID=1155944 RepID=A0A1I6R4C0_9BACL|nr:hypothetical protein [Marininema halotolerans]SFS59400.1 hypothetical protein SAMN05444972_10497 [Marininema halotolerans]
MKEEKFVENVTFNNASGGQINYANHGSTVYVTNNQVTLLVQLIGDLKGQLAGKIEIPEAEKEHTYQLLDMIQKQRDADAQKSLANIVLERLQKWQGVFTAASGTGQVITAIMDVLSSL